MLSEKIIASTIYGALLGLLFIPFTSRLLVQHRVAAFHKSEGGWTVSYNLGKAGADLLSRAAAAEVGLGSNTAEEAVYYSASSDAGGRRLNGAHQYVIHFDADNKPDVGAFWTISVYRLDQLLQSNPINRYSIGSKTPGLQYNPDGSLDLLIQHDPPEGKESNWLPVPSADFSLVLRAYQPGPAILAGTWEIPPVASTG